MNEDINPTSEAPETPETAPEAPVDVAPVVDVPEVPLAPEDAPTDAVEAPVALPQDTYQVQGGGGVASAPFTVQ